MITSELLLYKNLKYTDIINTVYDINENLRGGYAGGGNADDDCMKLKNVASELIEFAYEYGFSGNLWHALLAFVLANNENPYSMSSEIRGDIGGSLSDAVLYDFKIFKDLFDIDLESIFVEFKEYKLMFVLDYKTQEDNGRVFNKRIRDRILELSERLGRSENSAQIKQHVTEFYKEFGVGKFGLHKAFRVEHVNNINNIGNTDNADDGNADDIYSKSGGVYITPITNIQHVHLDDLVGYEMQKRMLIENTEAFINKRPCNNCLLYGEAGTGKSSSIKGILNEYYDKGLRIIELYKHQFKDLNDIIAQIKSRNYRFIIYMDDLSFEDFEVEYKYLKAVIEGGLEKKPENVLIYATSNRRHLVKENFSDRNDYDDELHSSDTKQEKLSLFSRFGVSIYFPSPEKKEFNVIVKELAKRHGLEMDEDILVQEANRWELSHGGLSGRTAAQFVDYMRGTL